MRISSPSSEEGQQKHGRLDTERFQRVIARIDALNQHDPSQQAFGYSQRLTAWVLRLEPNASEALRIAARGQHVQRWMIPRDRYERNRRGYLRWRETLKAFHATTITGLMREAGYPDAMIERVRRLILKKALGADPETQTLEDALCLLFLETQFADLRRKTAEETMREVLRKTWRKMSEPARAEARALPLQEADRRFLHAAITNG